MTAFNAVRFRVKAGRNQDFLNAHESAGRDWPGLRHVNLIQTGEQTYCIIGEWDSMDALAAARPHMIATLDTFRDMLDGDTDPVSGPVVLELK
jgi:quinol monooxygenase YgiN